MTKQEICKKYVGVPFENRGRKLGGLDCYGLVILIYKDIGIDLFDIDAEYPTNWSKRGENYMVENAHRDWNTVNAPALMDLALFNNSDGVGFHIGVMLDRATFIHTTKAGTTIGKMHDWRARLRTFYRHKYLMNSCRKTNDKN